MKLVRLARNVILARIAWRFIARERDALARRRRARRIVPALLVGGAGVAVLAARPRLLAGARRMLDAGQRRLDRNAEARAGREARPAGATPGPGSTDQPVRGPARSHGRGTQRRTAAPPAGHDGPKPGANKRRKNARREQAARRENAKRESKQAGSVKVEIDQPEDLRVPLGELKH